MPDTAHADAPFLVGNFLQGYMQAAQQQAMMRQQRAQTLMQMALQQSSIADKESDASVAALARKQARDYMNEADKAMHAKVGLWHLFSKVLGKGDTDPKQALEANLAAIDRGAGTTGTQLPVGGVALKDMSRNPPAVEAPSGEAALSDVVAGSDGNPPLKAAPPKQAPPPVLEGPEVARGMVGPTITGMRRPPEEEPMLETAPRMMGTPLTGRYAADAREGIKQPGQETKQGPERIRIAPDVVQHRIDGVNVNQEEYADFLKRLAFGRAAGADAAKRELEMMGARSKAEFNSKKTVLDQWEADSRARGEWNDAKARAKDKALFGVDPDDRVTMVGFNFRDQATGRVTKKFYYKDPQGRVTDQLAGEEDQDPTQFDAEVMDIMKDKGLSYDKAVSEWGNEKSKDVATQRRIHEASLKNQALEYKLKSQKADLERRAREGKLTRQEFILEAHDQVMEWVKGLQTLDIADKVAAVKDQMIALYGVTWEEYVKAIGGDPEKIVQAQEQDYLKKKSGSGGSTEGSAGAMKAGDL